VDPTAGTLPWPILGEGLKEDHPEWFEDEEDDDDDDELDDEQDQDERWGSPQQVTL
jgi:hypothetical protein